MTVPGKHWPALGIPVATPHQVIKDRPRPANGWPKTGRVGAAASLDVHEDGLPAPLPARPYTVGRWDRVEQLLAADTAPLPQLNLVARAIGWFRR